jgi:hypothetical protein
MDCHSDKVAIKANGMTSNRKRVEWPGNMSAKPAPISRIEDPMLKGGQNVKVIATKITRRNQMRRLTPVRLALLSMFGMGWSRSRIGVGLVCGCVTGALTARSLARKHRDSIQGKPTSAPFGARSAE